MADSAIHWSFIKKIPSTIEQAADVVRKLVAQLEKLNWGVKDTFAIHMATEEAIMNAVKHGNARDASKFVEVELRLTENRFYAKIADQGKGFDPEQVPDPCDDSNLEKTSGRGVSLIKNFVEDVIYNESGNTIEFSKTRSEQ